MYETLRRLYPIENYGVASKAPPVPSLGKRSTDRELSLTAKVLHGHGVIEVPLGDSYWVLPHGGRQQQPADDHRGENFGVQRPRNDYGNAYQKPVYARPNPNLWY
jgi:hypothetical protein